MAYTKQTWDTTSYVNPTRMNHIEDGIKNCDDNMNKVSQTVMGSSTDQYCVLISKSGNTSAETDTVRKASALTLQTNNGHLRISLPHSNTTEVVQPVSIGNDIPVGTEGNTTGSLRIFGKGNAYGQFRDSNGLLTANRTYELPNKSGILALTTDGIEKNTFNSGNTAHTITFSGSGRLRCASFLLFVAGMGLISNPIVIAFKGGSTGTNTITGVMVSDNDLGITATDLTVNIPILSSTYGTHVLIKLFPDDNITFTTT